MDWVCIDCGARQPANGICNACRRDDTLDLADPKVRELMADVEQRLADQRERRWRFLGVGIALAIVFGLWLVPGYWSLRGTLYPGLPVFLDQWIFMTVIGFVILKVGQRLSKKQRFPYLAKLA